METSAEHSSELKKYQLNLQLLVEWQLRSGNSIQLALKKIAYCGGFRGPL
jgi:hypothetical protein